MKSLIVDLGWGFENGSDDRESGWTCEDNPFVWVVAHHRLSPCVATLCIFNVRDFLLDGG